MIKTLKAKAQKQLAMLAFRKGKIEVLIEQELRKRLPCSLTLQHLKRIRLRLKDHMTALRYWLDDRNFVPSGARTSERQH